MKLIITGATGLVATEVLRQSLRCKNITQVVAVARKPVVLPGISDVEAAKLKSVVIEDYEKYPEHARREFADADACIWTVGITIGTSKLYPFEEVKRVCQTCTMAGFRAMIEARTAAGNMDPKRPFRFLYLSGSVTERDPSKPPLLYREYLLMRGETENQVLAYAAEQKPPGSVEACAAKPSMVTGHSTLARSVWGTALRWTNVVSNISVEELAAALLQQVQDGFEKEPLVNEDLKRIGKRVLAEGTEKSDR